MVSYVTIGNLKLKLAPTTPLLAAFISPLWATTALLHKLKPTPLLPDGSYSSTKKVDPLLSSLSAQIFPLCNLTTSFKNGTIDIIKLLLTNKHLNINAKNSNGNTALMVSSIRNKVAVLKLLLSDKKY